MGTLQWIAKTDFYPTDGHKQKDQIITLSKNSRDNSGVNWTYDSL